MREERYSDSAEVAAIIAELAALLGEPRVRLRVVIPAGLKAWLAARAERHSNTLSGELTDVLQLMREITPKLDAMNAEGIEDMANDNEERMTIKDNPDNTLDRDIGILLDAGGLVSPLDELKRLASILRYVSWSSEELDSWADYPVTGDAQNRFLKELLKSDRAVHKAVAAMQRAIEALEPNQGEAVECEAPS